MSENSKYVIEARKPTSFLVSLIQLLGKFVIGGIGFGLAVVIAIMMISTVTEDPNSISFEQYAHDSGSENSENKLLILDLAGPILGTPPQNQGGPFGFGFPGATYGYQLKDQILAAAKKDDIKGILLHTRTPGGTIFGSVAIHEAIKEYQEKTSKPIVVWIEGMSASGGVYSTVAADKIYAAPGSIIGSIGIIGFQFVYFDQPTALTGSLFQSGIETAGGIEVTVPHAGRGKDIGNPFRRVTDDEMKNIQNSLDTEYRAFVDHVATNRQVDAAQIIDVMGAGIFGNDQAESNGLIDGTKGREQAYDALAELAGVLEDGYQMVREVPPPRSFFAQLVGTFGLGEPQASSEDWLARVDADKCAAAQQIALVYHGPLSSLCAEDK